MAIEKLKFTCPIVNKDGQPYVTTNEIEDAFYDISAQIGANYPDKVVVIPKDTIALSDWRNYTTAIANDKPDAVLGVVIPNSVESIPTIAPSPDYPNYVNLNAFKNCSNLKSIIIPDSVTHIGFGAFSGCIGLESITLPFIGSAPSTFNSSSSNYTHFGSIFGAYAFTNGQAEFVPINLKTVTITGGRAISSFAFYDCPSLTSIELPAGLTIIGEGAFSSCSSLTSITIPDSVTWIGNKAFYNCSSLTSIVIPEGVTIIGDEAFVGCSSLESIEIPASVTSIGKYTFYNCSSLTNIVFTGTMARWHDFVNKGLGWDAGVPATKVVCSDGEIALYMQEGAV